MHVPATWSYLLALDARITGCRERDLDLSLSGDRLLARPLLSSAVMYCSLLHGLWQGQ